MSAKPLRAVTEVRYDGKQRRYLVKGDGHRTYPIQGTAYYEVLECGHSYIPVDHYHGGQSDPKVPGERRRCYECVDTK